MAITVKDIETVRAASVAEGSFFEVENRLVDGTEYAVYKHAPATFTDVLQAARNHGDTDFVVYQGRRYTYTQFFAAVDSFAATLQNEHGVVPGDRVAIAMRNSPEWMIAFVAGILVGAIVAPINSWGKTAELKYAIEDCGAKVLVADQQRFALIADEGLAVRSIVSGEVTLGQGDMSFETALGNDGSYNIFEASPEDPCVILFTSGSTGFPKGVLHRHIGMAQALMNMMWLGYVVSELEGGPRELKGGAEKEAPLLTVPLFHGTGLLGGLCLPMYLGYKVVVMYKWDSTTALELIQQEKVTQLSTVPAILLDLLNNPNFDSYATESLIRVTGAGAAQPAGLAERIEDKFGNPSRSSGYSMTEMMAVGSTQSGVLFDFKPEASGIVSPIAKLRSVDPDGNVLPQGQAGEFQFWSVCATPGYWEKPEANAKTFDNGWLRTGDVGLIDDDGFVHVTGRIKEIVIRGGENIYPGEIEQAAFELDKVQEVVVFGEPDAAMGEELVMVCYRKAGASLDEEELRSFLAKRLAGYKVPRVIRFSEEPLPRNASEKLNKLVVKERYLKELEPA